MRGINVASVLTIVLGFAGTGWANEEPFGDPSRNTQPSVPAQTVARSAPSVVVLQEPERAGDQYRKGRVALEVQGAPLGGPYGYLGFALDFALIPELSVSAGLGAGQASAQLGAAIKPRIPLSAESAVSFTAGYSYGDFREFGFGDVYSCEGCSWLNGDIGPEWRFPFHMLVRPFVGMSVLMGARKENAPPYISTSKGPGMTLGYVGVALGVFFDS